MKIASPAAMPGETPRCKARPASRDTPMAGADAVGPFDIREPIGITWVGVRWTKSI